MSWRPPQVGEQAAREAEDDIRKAVTDAHIVFVTAGMGEGPGPAPLPSSPTSQEMGALTIAVTTTPFKGGGACAWRTPSGAIQTPAEYC